MKLFCTNTQLYVVRQTKEDTKGPCGLLLIVIFEELKGFPPF